MWRKAGQYAWLKQCGRALLNRERGKCASRLFTTPTLVFASAVTTVAWAESSEGKEEGGYSSYVRRWLSPSAAAGEGERGRPNGEEEGRPQKREGGDPVFSSAAAAATAVRQIAVEKLKSKGVSVSAEHIAVGGVDGGRTKAVEFQILVPNEHDLLRLVSRQLSVEVINESVFGPVHEYVLEGDDPSLSIVITVQGGGGMQSDIFRQFDAMFRSSFGISREGTGGGGSVFDMDFIFASNAVVSYRRRGTALRESDAEAVAGLVAGAMVADSNSTSATTSFNSGERSVTIEKVGENGEKITIVHESSSSPPFSLSHGGEEDVEALFSPPSHFGGNASQQRRGGRGARGTSELDGVEQAKLQLEGAGVRVFLPADREEDRSSWAELAGYNSEKKQLRNTVSLVIAHSDVLSEVVKASRKHSAREALQEKREGSGGSDLTTSSQAKRGDDERKERRDVSSALPRAVLLTGPPGTGKTTAARILADELQVPLVLIPLESVVSKWYGEAEKNLHAILEGCRQLGEENGRRKGGKRGEVIVFVDELDALAVNRDEQPNEASRRLLSVLLRQVDGLEGRERGARQTQSHMVLLGATNRAEDLDRALLNRFDTTIHFGLPTAEGRKTIFTHYAYHLSETEVKRLGEDSTGMTGRDIMQVCNTAQREWTLQLIAEKEKNGSFSLTPPPFDYYSTALKYRMEAKARVEKAGTDKNMRAPLFFS